ncbi:MAG: DMT family transporter [Rhodocyclaceae bacterium]|nr:DMT family transporter [Rhodocyclaceae bacterium]MBX3670020.1 DMT family transporter [Rhodocyclaceae bacterium]
MMCALLCFSVLDASFKYLVAEYPLPVLVWARYTTHTLFMLAIFAPRMGSQLLRTGRLRMQITRGLILVAVTALNSLAFRMMPLAEVTALVFLSPVFVTLLAGPLLGERVRAAKWVACALGFAGVLCIARPGGSIVPLGVLICLVSALFLAAYQIITRMLGPGETAVTTLFYTALTGSLVSLPAVPLVWDGQLPDPRHAMLIASLGLWGGIGHFLFTRAYMLAPASSLAPLAYVQLVWATLLGWLVFDHLPDRWSVVGGIVIACGGLLAALSARSHD